MTPELRNDIRTCMLVLEQAYAAGYGGSRFRLEAATRVLAWLDEYERLHTPIMPMDDDEMDNEYTWLDFAGSV